MPFLYIWELLLGAKTALAIQIPDRCIQGLECTHAGFNNGAVNISQVIQVHFYDNAIFVFGGFLFLMIVIYAIKMLTAAGDEGQVSEAKNAFAHAIIGTILVATSTVIANAFFLPDGTSILLADVGIGVIGGAHDGSLRILKFIKNIAIIGLVVNIVYQAIRLIVSQDDSQSQSARRNLVFGFIGMMITMIALPIVDAFNTDTNAGGLLIAVEIAGIAGFLSTIFGLLGALSIMIGGMFLVIGVDDSVKNQAKKAIVGGIVVLLLVFLSFVIINLFPQIQTP